MELLIFLVLLCIQQQLNDATSGTESSRHIKHGCQQPAQNEIEPEVKVKPFRTLGDRFIKVPFFYIKCVTTHVTLVCSGRRIEAVWGIELNNILFRDFRGSWAAIHQNPTRSVEPAGSFDFCGPQNLVLL